jgi:uncharacterized protein YjeT (DUF2065 family)
MGYFLSVLGMVLIIEAVPYVLFPGQVKSFAQFIHAVPNGRLQAVGVVAAFIGLLVIYLGRIML